MKLMVATFTIVAAIMAGTVGASTQGRLNYIGYGYWVKAPQAGGIAAVPMSGRGYGVGMHRNFVMVMNLQTKKVVFTRMQP